MIIAPALRKPVASVGRRLHLINAPPLPLHSSSIQNILLIPHLWPYVFPATAYMLIYTSLPSNIAQTSLYQTGCTYQLLFTTMIENLIPTHKFQLSDVFSWLQNLCINSQIPLSLLLLQRKPWSTPTLPKAPIIQQFSQHTSHLKFFKCFHNFSFFLFLLLKTVQSWLAFRTSVLYSLLAATKASSSKAWGRKALPKSEQQYENSNS